MKRIIINESQNKRILEAYQPKFSFKELEKLYETRGYASQYIYCKKMLGNSVGCGSSRVIFTLSDNMVLKLAGADLPEAGIDQNINEYRMYKKCNSPLLPRIYYHDKHFSFLVCESVIPAQTEDFEKILGIPWYHYYSQNTEKKLKNMTHPEQGDKEVGYNKYFNNIKKPWEQSEQCIGDILLYIEDVYTLQEGDIDPSMEKIIKGIPWLQSMEVLAQKYGLQDFNSIENFGIVNRDGNPTIVVLDSGLDDEVYDNYYAIGY